MKSLIISLLYPLPENSGGRMRTMNFVRYMKEHGEVDLLYLNEGSKEGNISAPFRKEFCIRPSDESLEVSMKNKNVLLNGFKESFNRITDRRPMLLTEWSSSASNELIELITSEMYDIVLCRYIYSSYPLFKLPARFRKRIVIDFDDFYSDANIGASKNPSGNIYRKMKNVVEKKLIFSYQKRCLGFGAVLVCSKEDMEMLAVSTGLQNVNALVIPNICPPGVVGNHADIDKNYNNRNKMLFVGTLNYGPNLKGLKWFLDKIFPHIHGQDTNTKFLIVGRDPYPEFVSFCKEIPGVELYPNVPDVGVYYDQCGIVVVPVLSGGGTRIKILEAAMTGKPVFSTPFGAYGLDVEDGKNIMMFAGHEEFSEKLQIIDDKQRYCEISGNLKRVVELKYSREALIKAMDNVVARLANRI